MARWKYVEGWEGRYEVSDCGEVRSWYYGKRHLETPRIMKLKINKYGYLEVSLKHGTTIQSKTIHRLVAKAFIPNPNSLPQINHVDGNKLNNRFDNLQWCTSQTNMRHAFENGLISKQRLSEGQKKRYANESEREKSRQVGKSVWTDDFRKKMKDLTNSEDYKKRMSEIRKKQVPPTLGMKWINNGVENKVVKKDLLNNYLGKGWSLGRTKIPRKAR